MEATARGIKFAPISIEKSDANRFVLDDEHENTLIPPFSTIDGLGAAVATTIVEERQKQPFLSKEDLQRRGKVSKTLPGARETVKKGAKITIYKSLGSEKIKIEDYTNKD